MIKAGFGNILVSLFILTASMAYADDPLKDISPAATQTGTKLDLSIPESHLEAPSTEADTQSAVTETAKQKELREHCSQLSRQIEALRGQFKPQRRAALIERHRVECTDQGR